MPENITIAVFKTDIDEKKLSQLFSPSMIVHGEFETIHQSGCCLHGIDMFQAIHFYPIYKEKHINETLGQIYCLLYDEPIELVEECVKTLQTWIKKTKK